MFVSVCDFHRIATEWQKKHLMCPRCGCGDDVFFTSKSSGVLLCNYCFKDEECPLYENYDNWAIVTAVRAVCDTDIKIKRSVCQNVACSNGCSSNQVR